MITKCIAVVTVGILTSSTIVTAHPMPNVSTLQALMGSLPTYLTVIEPHLSAPNNPVKVTYEGYPANEVLTKLLGPKWNATGDDIEFTATDGYISRITTTRLAKYEAFIAFARQDHQPFLINNRFQQEPNVTLGPYYLVWDNVKNPSLLTEGGTHWPYQVVGISLVKSADAVLLPGALKARYQTQAELAQTLCLTCHKANSYGGTKMPINLAARVKQMSELYFVDWVLKPRAVKPNTHMPALSQEIPEAQRQTIAKQLYEYFYALPVTY